MALCLLLGQSRLLPAAEVKPEEKTGTDPEENLTEAETDEAEFRQGGIGQQLGLSGYGLYAGASNPGLQYAAAASNAGNGGYVNMLRNLYRPQQASMGLTDKVKHWVKSFMNRRQYVKPYYSPSGLQYSADEFGGGKPMFVGSGYKAISVPLRQLQKYYKPMYAGESGQSQLGSQLGSAGSSSILTYNPSGLYTAGDGTQFSSSSLFGDNNAAAALFASGGSSAGSNLFSSYGGGQGAGLFSQGGGESPTSALFSAQGLYGSAGSAGSQSGSGSSSGLYPSASGSYSLDSSSNGGNGGNLYASESGNSAYFGSGGSRFLNGGSSSGYGGDLFASGASPAASVYNPGEQGGRGYGTKKLPSSYGSSGSALYMSSSDQRAAESSPSFAVKEPPSGFDSSSRGSSPPESHSYSVSFQPTSAQGKSYGGGNSGFQPVSFEYPGKSS